jgi:hypothetical protein
MRQHGYSTLASTPSQYGLETNSVNKMLDYNYGVQDSNSSLKYSNALPISSAGNSNSYIAGAISAVDSSESHNVSALSHESYLNSKNSLSATNDSKFHSNPFKFYLSKPSDVNASLFSDIPVTSSGSSPVDNLNNVSQSYKFKDVKSSNLNFLSSDKNVRNLDQSSLSKNNFNMMSDNTNLSSLISSTLSSNGASSTNELNLYEASTHN